MQSSAGIHLIGRDAGEIRIGIVGMGKMGAYHLRALEELASGCHEEYYKGAVSSQLRKLRVCGICDRDAGRLASHGEVAGYGTLGELLREGRPDMVIIAAPTQLHYDLACEALEAGVHVLVEKPLVTKGAEIESLVALARSKGCRLISGHVERYNPVSIKIVSLLGSAGFEAGSYRFCRTQRHDERIPDDIIIDKVIHDLDLSLYFFGPIVEVSVVGVRREGGQVYEARLATAHESGVRGELFVSWLVAADVKCREVEILGAGGRKLKGDFLAKRLLVDGAGVDCEVPRMIKPENNQIKDELVDFVLYCSEPDASVEAVEPLLSLGEIVHTVKLIEQVTAVVAGK